MRVHPSIRHVVVVAVVVVVVVVVVGPIGCAQTCDDDADCRVRDGRVSCANDGECQAKATSSDICVDLGEGGECRPVLNGGACTGIGGRVFAQATAPRVGIGGDATVCVELAGTCGDDGVCAAPEN